ncbi:premelanosome protein a [Dunckerocampus dactyliophorus]|uniref:premelanosome protein a n=1 Tax=Dunckerocampus dactyliophorus TaxID=161453 RepID=UPI0024067CAA|nr:premelanosome protein a [Dunckerocampus dactyliophorus]
MKILLLVVLALASATAQKPRSQFTRYRSWNSRMYPVWRDGDPRFRNCWAGGEVTFDLKNDAPTLVGAKATFNINLNFPSNQTVLPNGQVVWARNCTVNGQQYQAGQSVYPDQNEERSAVFPDGTPFTSTRDKKPHYVYVWKTWGKYWQVADGPSSSLTIATDNVALGSYNMEVVIYHCRGKDKFVPLGYASTVFTITDQIPFTVALAQVNDINQDDSNFIQNRAIAFSVNLHDPSQYLSGADISFSWDFGDSSGILISRERTVTHTYLSVGTFNPQVVLMASIPNGCVNPSAVVPVDASAASVVVVTPAADPAAADVPASDTDLAAADVPTSDATPVQPSEADTNTDDTEDPETEEIEAASVAPAGIDTAIVPAEQDPAATAATAAEVAAEDTDGEAATAEETSDAAVDGATEEAVPAVDAAASVAPVAEGEEATVDVAATVLPEAADTVTTSPEVTVAEEGDAVAAAEDADVAAEVVQNETEAPDNVVVPAATESTTVEEAAEEAAGAEVPETDNNVDASIAPAGDEAVPTEGEGQAEVEADPAQVVLVVKRQVPEVSADCMVYRYGSLSTSVDVIQGIESVEIVQMSNVVSLATDLDQNAVDVTISCQGSLPSEVCTVISDADCITPVETVCSVAAPSPDCQLVLRQFFNDSGVFCLNVSLTNDVSLAVASARVSVAVASSGSPAGTAATILGVMVLACVVCCIGLMYRRFKQYQPLREDNDGSGTSVTSVPLLLWNLLMRQSPGESRPLLQGRVV